MVILVKIKTRLLMDFILIRYQSLSKVIRNVYLEGPSGNRTLASKPDLGGQIGVPQLVDSILGKIYTTSSAD